MKEADDLFPNDGRDEVYNDDDFPDDNCDSGLSDDDFFDDEALSDDEDELSDEEKIYIEFNALKERMRFTLREREKVKKEKYAEIYM